MAQTFMVLGVAGVAALGVAWGVYFVRLYVEFGKVIWC
jgi:hypothetical protein